MDAESAETIALSALAFLADDLPRLGRFLALTGLGPGELRNEAASPRILAAVLGHLLQDESLLLVFAAGQGIAPKLIAPAHAVLEVQAGSAANDAG
jgi:Protein of unknown function (DUF3572)